MTEENYDQLEKMVDADSLARRADPLKFLCEVIEPLRDTKIEGFFKIWRTQATHYRWYADDAMDCLDRILADPPANLVKSLSGSTVSVLNRVTPGKITPYTHSEVVTWLSELRDKLFTLYEETAQ